MSELMNELIWMFPVLFIVHDMEEIIGFGLWLGKNRPLLDQKYPRISHTYRNYSTEGMAAAVMEELVLCLVLCVLARFAGFYGLWFGGFVAYTIHLVVHIFQSIAIRKYIPALITSIICLPLSIWVIKTCITLTGFTLGECLIYSAIGLVIIVGNLKLAHAIIRLFTKKMNFIGTIN